MIINLTEAVIYIAFGLLVYLLAYGQPDWSDAWVYVIVGLWPFVLAWWFLPYIIAGVAIWVAISYAATWWLCHK